MNLLYYIMLYYEFIKRKWQNVTCVRIGDSVIVFFFFFETMLTVGKKARDLLSIYLICVQVLWKNVH